MRKYIKDKITYTIIIIIIIIVDYTRSDKLIKMKSNA
jgi:hypothetical protein